MKPSAQLVNVARGRVVDEAALDRALRASGSPAAALDVTARSRCRASPLWGCRTCCSRPTPPARPARYEDGVIDILLENLDRLWRGETTLRNQVL